MARTIAWDGRLYCTSVKCKCGRPVNLRVKNGRTVPIHIVKVM